MKITIVYDNCQGTPGLKTGWGFSALVEGEESPPLLFDTGDDGSSLLYNMQMLDIDPRQIGIIVISHNHWDHTGGLNNILDANEKAEIYVPSSFHTKLPGRKVNVVTASRPVCKDIFTTGELKGIEQSLAVKTCKGIVTITGCSHPGVQSIIDAASIYGKIYGIIGGLHGFHNFEQLKDLSLICPCHCTQYKAELSGYYPAKYKACKVGLELSL